MVARRLASAQDAPIRDADAAVRATIARLFDGMRAKDTTAIRSTLHPDARLMTAAHREARSVESTPFDGVPEAASPEHPSFSTSRSRTATR